MDIHRCSLMSMHIHGSPTDGDGMRRGAALGELKRGWITHDALNVLPCFAMKSHGKRVRLPQRDPNHYKINRNFVF